MGRFETIYRLGLKELLSLRYDPLMVFQVLNQVTQAQLAGLTNEFVALRRQAMAAPAIVPAKPGDVAAIAGSLRAFRDGR